MAMKKHEPVSTAQAILGLLVLAIVATLFYKFITNKQYFMDDPEALRNYVMYTVVGAGFLIGLMYLGSNVTHTPKKAKSAPPKKAASKTSAKKKKK